MANFNIGALRDWFPLTVGQGYLFDIPENGFRAVRFDVLSDRPVAVLAVTPDGQVWPLAKAEGMIEVAFSTDENVTVMVAGDKETIVSMRSRIETQVIAESGETSFVRAQPRQTGLSEDVRRVMYVMGLNAQRREAALRDELARLAASIPATPSTAPAPQASTDG